MEGASYIGTPDFGGKASYVVKYTGNWNSEKSKNI